MIQQLERTGQKGGQSTFILFTPKWSQIKDPKKIKDKIVRRTATFIPTNINVRLSDTTKPKFSSCLTQFILSADAMSNVISIVGSDIGDNDEGDFNNFEL